MEIKVDNISRLIVVGDRVLIRKRKNSEKTRTGLLLPPGVEEKEELQSGYIIKTGPGYPLPIPHDEEESWKAKEEVTRYLPLQAHEGDLAIFMQKQAVEIEFNKEKFFIVPNAALLLLYREE